jgi:hypothetical protein
MNNLELLILILIIGIAFGFLRRGKDDKWELLKQGAIIGIVLGIIFGLISLFLAPGSIALGTGLVGGISIFIGIVILVIIFVVGVFIGDLEGILRK